ncbi:carboxymuconolactone decarboxylase family protein [Rhodococcus sp. T2V]|uniref:carboxymuconolactone decarboxylase family protein n=1 Tax=Rhodococcus sp. T2V TaxID=3034164 RepID=UPI0023E34A1C|nr:carboxymuconolactone decarboxylase family protein [Rhodococcus sp. T2V]MDF3307379.1 carboxymuconolactone decarboxylase family protein [Rhodococcus sp. T2V]
MSDMPGPARRVLGSFAPKLAELTDDTLFGDVWKRRELTPRDRSLVTVAALVALYRTDQLPFHLRTALDNGLTVEELVEVATHLAFYSGWPTAMTALQILRDLPDAEGADSWPGR